jgi:AbrB family looped-hinge helix DNA binding protein
MWGFPFFFSPYQSQIHGNFKLHRYGISVRLHYGISDWRSDMKGNIVVSGRGQITLPASMRRRLGIKAGGVLVVEDRKGELVLRPAAVVELDTYTDEEIGRWEREDRLAPGERSRILKKLDRKR